MKTIILKTVLLIFILLHSLNISLVAQQDSIINKLNSELYSQRFQARDYIEENKLYQYIPALEERIFLSEDDFEVYNFLRVLDELNAQNLQNITSHFIDTIDYYPGSAFMDKLELKVDATGILINLQDYSTINYLWQILERDKPGGKIEPSVINILSELLYVPQYETRAKQELLDIYNSSYYRNMEDGLFNFRPQILGILVKKYGMEIKDILLESFLNDPSVSIRISSIDYLREINYPRLDTLLIYKLYSQTLDTVVNPIIGLNITQMLNTPQGLHTLTTYKPTIINQSVEEAINRYVEARKYSEAKRIYLESLSQYLDTIKTFISDLQAYNWLGDLTFSNELKNILTTAKTNLQNGDSLTCRVQVKSFQDLVDNVYKDSLNSDPRFVTIEGWKFLYWNAKYILDRLPEPPANPNLIVNLKNSFGTQIPASNVMYYDGSWKDAVNNGDGTFTVKTTKPTVSVRVFYEGANQTVNNVPAQNNTYTFQTVNAAVQLKNSSGNLMDQGTVQYYAGAWRSFGTTSNGVAYKELLPVNYSFRMTYEYGSIDKQQDISTNPTVVFQTVNAAVQLKNSFGNLIDAGTVQYYAGAWRSFGSTSNGVAYKELLPINYTFRMTYEFVSKDKQQNLSTNPVVDFSTVLCSVKVSKTSSNQPINNAAVKYYSGAWRNLGTTNATGIAAKELLPSTLSFRATVGNVTQDKQQDISVNNLVEILLNIP